MKCLVSGRWTCLGHSLALWLVGFCRPHYAENEGPSFGDSIFAKFHPHETEFRGIQDCAKYNDFNVSKNRAKDGSFGSAERHAKSTQSSTDRHVFEMWLGTLTLPCSLLGFANSIPSRKVKTNIKRKRKQETKTRHTTRTTQEVMQIYVVTTSGTEGKTEYG